MGVPVVSLTPGQEIIETYWNVNLGNKIRDGIVETEIIETYWNILKCK